MNHVGKGKGEPVRNIFLFLSPCLVSLSVVLDARVGRKEQETNNNNVNLLGEKKVCTMLLCTYASNLRFIFLEL